MAKSFSSKLSIKTPALKKSTGLGRSSTADVYTQSMKSYTKAALQTPLSFGNTAMHQTPSLVGMAHTPQKPKRGNKF